MFLFLCIVMFIFIVINVQNTGKWTDIIAVDLDSTSMLCNYWKLSLGVDCGDIVTPDIKPYGVWVSSTQLSFSGS